MAIKFNPLKYKVMHLGRGNPVVYSMADHTSGEVVELSLVEEEKNLGTSITSNLSQVCTVLELLQELHQYVQGQLKRPLKL